MTTDKVDYLEVDKEINGQQFCCLSFVEPTTDRLAHKEAFFFHKFIEHYGHILYIQFCKHHGLKPDASLKIEMEELYDRYADFKAIKYTEVCKEYDTEVNNETHIRAIKVRGSYSSEAAANAQANKLRKSDPSFDVFVGQVGYWVPFNPVNLNDIKPEYMEEKMQELVKAHLDNELKKDELFEQRRSSMMDQIKVETKTEPCVLEEVKEEVKEEEPKHRRKIKKELPPALKTKLQEQMLMFQTNQDAVRDEALAETQSPDEHVDTSV